MTAALAAALLAWGAVVGAGCGGLRWQVGDGNGPTSAPAAPTSNPVGTPASAPLVGIPVAPPPPAAPAHRPGSRTWIYAVSGAVVLVGGLVLLFTRNVDDRQIIEVHTP